MANQIIKLKSGNNYLYPYSSLGTIDGSDVLATIVSNGSTYTYTTTEDCYVMATIGEYGGGSNQGCTIYINDNKVIDNFGASKSYKAFVTIPLAKGDVFYKTTGYLGGSIFGISK